MTLPVNLLTWLMIWFSPHFVSRESLRSELTLKLFENDIYLIVFTLEFNINFFLKNTLSNAAKFSASGGYTPIF